jgi:hypothetical protein
MEDITPSPAQAAGGVIPSEATRDDHPLPRRKPSSSTEIPKYYPDSLGEGLLVAAAEGNESNLRLFYVLELTSIIEIIAA